MEVKHCGLTLTSFQQRWLKPTPDEERRGITGVLTLEYWCSDNRCRKRLFYRQDHTQTEQTEFSRVRPHQRAAFIARLRRAKESDWVWGHHKELYTPIKVTVR